MQARKKGIRQVTPRNSRQVVIASVARQSRYFGSKPQRMLPRWLLAMAIKSTCAIPLKDMS